MSFRTFAALSLTILSMSAQAGEEQFDVKQELSSSYLKESLPADVSLFISGERTPEFAEVGKEETYTAVSISLSPFGGSRRHCLDALQKALKSLADAAVAHGYDAVVNIRPASDANAVVDVRSLKCTPGYKVTPVSISGSLAMSSAAKQRQAEEEQKTFNLPARPPANGAIFVPIGPILESPEAKKILIEGISMHWGGNAPEFRYRYGPDDYSENADIEADGAEGACKVATLKVFRQIVAEAKDREYDSIIKLRSHLDEEYSPNVEYLECQISKKKVYVTIQATLAQKK